MTTLTLPRIPERPARPKSVLRYLAALAEGIAEGRAMATRYRALSQLSDAELARRGLTRDAIPQAVVDGVDRR